MSQNQVTPNFDAAAAYPEVAAARAALRSQDWGAVRALYDPLDWNARQLVVFDAADQHGVEHLLRQVIERDPEDLVATSMYAARLVVMGWNIRSAARARYVSETQFQTFFDYLRQAEETLIWVCARDPGQVAAWCERVLTARGLELGVSEARRRYDRLNELAPHFVPGQTQLLQRLCPKWGGDFATMHAFASQCAQEAPPGAQNAMLVVDGHMEHWLEASESGTRPGTYFASAQVKAEIRAAGERSVLHPDFRRMPGWVKTMSMFALGYSMIGDWTLAKRCFTELGPHADDDGWCYLDGGAAKEFAEHRKRAMERG